MMMPVRITSPSLDACPMVARKILHTFRNKRIFAFWGKMGSGKTTLIRFICRELGVVDFTSSPSFTIVNEYLSCEKGKVYHFDFYRIKSISEAYNLGYEEYFYSGHYCLIEWPEKIEELLPPESVYIHLEDPSENQARSLTFNMNP